MIEWLLETGPVQNYVLLVLIACAVLGLISSMNAVERGLKKYFNW